MPSTQQLTLTWRQIDIQIDFTPSSFEAYKQTYGEALAHIELRANEPLPMTETGYKSLFLPLSEVAGYGGPCEMVKVWLETSSQSKGWKQYDQDRRQLSLF